MKRLHTLQHQHKSLGEHVGLAERIQKLTNSEVRVRARARATARARARARVRGRVRVRVRVRMRIQKRVNSEAFRRRRTLTPTLNLT